MAAAQSRARSTGRNDTNGRLRTNSRAAASERRSSQPRIHVISRNLHGCRRRKSTATAKLSSSERNRCSGVNDSLPICTWSAGRTRMFRTQSVFSPQTEQMAVSCTSRLSRTPTKLTCGSHRRRRRTRPPTYGLTKAASKRTCRRISAECCFEAEAVARAWAAGRGKARAPPVRTRADTRALRRPLGPHTAGGYSSPAFIGRRLAQLPSVASRNRA